MTTPAEPTQGTGLPECLEQTANHDWSLPLNTVQDVMLGFDFAAVHTVMTALKWTWGAAGVPSQEMLEATARDLLTQVATNDPWKPELCITTGGFVASRCGTLSLAFQVARGWAHTDAGAVVEMKEEVMERPSRGPVESMEDVARMLWSFLCDALGGKPSEAPIFEEGSGRALVTWAEVNSYLTAAIDGLLRSKGLTFLTRSEAAACKALEKWLDGLGLPHAEALRNEREVALLRWFREWDEQAQTGEDADSVRVLLLGNTEEVPLVFDQLCNLPRVGTFWRKVPRELFRDAATRQTGQAINLHSPRESQP